MKIKEFHEPVRPDTYEASMALNQLMKIGKHAIKLHKLIDDSAEMEAWVQKKIDLAGDYVKKVHGYMGGEKAGLYDDNGLTEDAPFDGMSLIRMAIMKKFITVQEWDLLKHKWKDAVEELEQNYDDWPEGEGFGSSDHNFAIKELMELVGYEFDDQDTSGRFVVTKQPEEIEKAGIKNARMKDAVATEDESDDIKTKPKYHIYHHLDHARNILGSGRFSDDDELEFQDYYKEIDALISAKVPGSDTLAKMRQFVPGVDDSEEDRNKDLRNMVQVAKDYLILQKNVDDAAMDHPVDTATEDAGNMDLIGDGAENLGLDPNKFDYYYDTSGAGYGEVRTKSGKAILQFEYDRDGDAEVSTMDNKTIANIKQGEQLPNNVTSKLNMIKEDAGEDEKIVDMLRNIKQHLDNHPNMSEHPSLVALDQLADDLESGDKPADYESVSEDAGEGHMSKSTLYHTAKYAIELASMIKPGDDLEGWVQSKLNKAADYLQGAYNYEEYQKLNPYREELDSNTLSKHAQVVQKHIDEILARETKLDDIDTKPGMMRILSKRVNEVEKEMAKIRTDRFRVNNL